MTARATSWDPSTFIELTAFREVDEVLRRGRDFLLNGTKFESDEFVHGTMVAIDGPDHMARRRQLLRMINPKQPWGAEGTLLEELLEVWRGRLLHALDAEGGMYHFDLIGFCRDVMWQFTARMVGLDEIDSEQKVREFVALASPVLHGLAAEYAPADTRDTVVAAAREASERIRTEIFLPSVERRRELLAEVAAGRLAADDLPADLIASLLASHDGDDVDLEPIFREMVELLAGSINNPVSQVAWGVDDLASWLPTHPEDSSRLGDKDFLNLAVKETLRLHRSSRPYLVRIAAKDVVLESTGREISEGSWVASWLGAANQDPTVFGEDADTYNPYRTIDDPKVAPFGVAFGGGPHVCLGRPMLVWDQGGEEAQGLQSKFLRWLFAHGVQPDPQGVHEVVGEQGGRRYERYDVMMPTAQDTA